MPPLLVLPAPLHSSSITLGQLVTDPLHADLSSLKPSNAPASKQATIQSKYQDTITHDEHGHFTSTRFISNLSGQAHYSHENLLLLDAEQMSHTAIDKPSQVFDTLRRDPTTQSFLREMARDSKPVYFVTGIQTLKNPSFKHAVVQHGLITEATTPQFRLPVRRVDSASSLDKPNSNNDESEESVLAVQLLRVKCFVGAVNEPHSISDLDYVWSYHFLDHDDDDQQLSIGLGKAVEASELRAQAEVAGQESYTETNWSYDYDSESEDGIGGF